MKNILQKFTKLVLTGLLILVSGCQEELNKDNAEELSYETNSFKLTTVSKENTINFLRKFNRDHSKNRKMSSTEFQVDIDIETLEQIEITNSDAKINIANASAGLAGVESEFLQIEINGELQTVLFHHISESKESSSKNSKTTNKIFSGSIFSTDLKGKILCSFIVQDGKIYESYNSAAKFGDPTNLQEVVIKNNYHAPKNPYTVGAMMQAGFVREQSMNNYGSIGTAYASYFKYLKITSFNKEIKDAKLKACLKKILDNLKKTTSSPGNMISNFSGSTESTNFNWTVQTGPLYGPTGSTSPPYNPVTGVTTTFDSQNYPEATDLSWARTILHEAIHAYLITYFATSRPSWIATYPEMVKDWGIKQNWNAVHHEEIGRSLVTYIGDALEVYAVSQGYKLSKEFYQDMAWGGLQETDAFKDLPKKDQERISNVLQTELTGLNTDGDQIPQKGKKAGC